MNQSVTLTFKISRKTFVKQISVFIHHFLFHGANIVILTGNAHTYFTLLSLPLPSHFQLQNLICKSSQYYQLLQILLLPHILRSADNVRIQQTFCL